MLLDSVNKPLITIEYCVPWDYVPQAVSLAEVLMNEFSWEISAIQLVPGTEGAFEVTFDGELIYSKKQIGEFPENKFIVKLISDRQ